MGSSSDNREIPDGLVKQNIELVDKMILEKSRVDEEIRRGFQDPLNKYKSQYREIDERIRERSRRSEEVAKLSSEVKKYEEKKDARLSGTQRRLETAKQALQDLHAELSEDIPRLVADKVAFFDPLVAILIDVQIHFYKGMSDNLLDLQSQITHIDRSSIKTHPQVIRPRQQSAVGRTYSSFASHPTGTTEASSQSQSAYKPSPYAPQSQNQTYNENLPPVPIRSGMPPPITTGPPRIIGLWDFNSAQPGELPFKANDVLNLIDSKNPDWWTAELDGRQGLVPANYVRLI